MKEKINTETIFISDLHLGASNCQHKRIKKLLLRIFKQKRIKCNSLIILGDIVDKPKLNKLKNKDWEIINLIKLLSEKISVKIILGNHDSSIEFLQSIFKGIDILEDIVISSGEKEFYCCHGHKYDIFISNYPVITAIADSIYSNIQKIDKSHNLSKLLKKKSKKFIKCSQNITKSLAYEVINKKYYSGICGHTHLVGEYEYENVKVYNTGCFTEKPCSYLSLNNGIVTIHYIPKKD